MRKIREDKTWKASGQYAGSVGEEAYETLLHTGDGQLVM